MEFLRFGIISSLALLLQLIFYISYDVYDTYLKNEENFERTMTWRAIFIIMVLGYLVLICQLVKLHLFIELIVVLMYGFIIFLLIFGNLIYLERIFCLLVNITFFILTINEGCWINYALFIPILIILSNIMELSLEFII